MITSTNPMVYTDFPDPDIIRVGGVYYMATMHFTPGCDILRSYDLVHWEFIAHALNIVADTPEERLECEGANAYGRGMWAPSLRYHRGAWYVLFAANDTHVSYLLTADDPCGPWRKRELDGFYYDSGLFFGSTGSSCRTIRRLTLVMRAVTCTSMMDAITSSPVTSRKARAKQKPA